MASLVSLFITVGMAVSSVMVAERIDIQADSLNMTTGIDSLPQQAVAPEYAAQANDLRLAQRQTFVQKDTLNAPGGLRTVSKKNQTRVKNSNEIDLPDMMDENPLLTQITLYDPFEYRVWPREPLEVPENPLPESILPQPLFLPLVFGLHQRDLSLKQYIVSDTTTALFTQRTDSFMKVCQYGRKTIQDSKFLLVTLESHLPQYVEYDKAELPAADPLIFFLRQEKPFVLDRPVAAYSSTATKNNSIMPNVTYNPWSRRGNFKLHFSETHLSSNWSKGGESNMAGLLTLYLEAKYNNLKNVQFDNSVELKVGMNTVASDTLRNLNVSIDQLRVLNKLGIKMYNNWYYSLSSDFSTQVMNNYRKNTMTLQSALLSPAKLYVSLGVDFKKADAKKGNNFSVMLSPLTYKLNYLHDIVNFNPKSYNIEPGKHFGSEIGSKIDANLIWKISERLAWKSRFNYFTDYTYVDTEFENTVDLMLNNYFSTQFYLDLRLDDSLERTPGESLIQMQQLFSFGMSYRF